MEENYTDFDFSKYDENAAYLVDYNNNYTNVWPYSTNDSWVVDAFFQQRVTDLQDQFTAFNFLLDKNESSEYYPCNFYSIIISGKDLPNKNEVIVFMINKHIPVAVWGSDILNASSKGTGFERRYVLPANLYINNVSEIYTKAIEGVMSDLKQHNIQLPDKEILLKKHKEPATQTKYCCIDVEGSLQTLLGYTFNVFDEIMFNDDLRNKV